MGPRFVAIATPSGDDPSGFEQVLESAFCVGALRAVVTANSPQAALSDDLVEHSRNAQACKSLFARSLSNCTARFRFHAAAVPGLRDGITPVFGRDAHGPELHDQRISSLSWYSCQVLFQGAGYLYAVEVQLTFPEGQPKLDLP